MAVLEAPASLWDMPSFLEQYTLHDSQLQEVRLIPGAGLLVLIDWDLHWNAIIPQPYNTLVIQFKVPYVTNWHQGAWHQSTLEGATSIKVSNEEREKMLNESAIDLRALQQGTDEIQPYMLDDTLTRTVFEGMNWGALEVLHNQQVCFTCFDNSGNTWSIPRHQDR